LNPNKLSTINHQLSNIEDLLEFKYNQYNTPSFIEKDPISIPHQFTAKEDIEISGFLAATIAWGQRITAVRNANKIVQLMDYNPYDFVMNHTSNDLKPFKKFVHRTFKGEDCIYFIKSLKNIYAKYGGLEKAFNPTFNIQHSTLKYSLINFHNIFFESPAKPRTMRHLSNPAKNSAAKRLNMFLRWMVRKDKHGVDFGIWKTVKPSQLFCPLDIHSGNVARALGLISRNANDWKAVEELTSHLRLFDPSDPVKYDFALFGLGIFEGFK
jgi:uncharacterized protein (TIGR02757 family)